MGRDRSAIGYHSPAMKRILILFRSTSYRAEAFLEAAERVGVRVAVGSEHEQALARFHDEGHLRLDFDDDRRGAAAIADFHREHPLDAILAADDDGVLIAARAAAALGLRGNPAGAVNTVRNKHLFRQALRDAALPAPWFACADVGDAPREWARRVSYPCVLKPTFLSGSRGVIRADDAHAFEWAFLRIRNLLADPVLVRRGGGWAREILVEAYLPGDEVALEGLLTEGALRVLAIFDKPDPLEGPYFEESLYITPSSHRAADREALVQAAWDAAHAVGLVTGPVHVEMRLKDGAARLIELAPRSIGGLCSRVLRFGDGGVSLEELIIRHALGEDVLTLTREPPAAGVMMIPIPRAGILRAVNGRDAAARTPGVDELRITIPAGDLVLPPPDGARYLGFIFARGARPEDVDRALRAAHDALDIVIDDVD